MYQRMYTMQFYDAAPSSMWQPKVLGFCQHDEWSCYWGRRSHSLSAYISSTEVRPILQNLGNLASERFICFPNGHVLAGNGLINKIKTVLSFFFKHKCGLCLRKVMQQKGTPGATLCSPQTPIASMNINHVWIWGLVLCVQESLSWTIKPELIGLWWSWILMCDPELNSKKEPPPRTPLTNCATVDFTRSDDDVHAKRSCNKCWARNTADKWSLTHRSASHGYCVLVKIPGPGVHVGFEDHIIYNKHQQKSFSSW